MMKTVFGALVVHSTTIPQMLGLQEAENPCGLSAGESREEDGLASFKKS